MEPKKIGFEARLEFEEEVKSWAKLTKRELIKKLRSLDMRQRTQLGKMAKERLDKSISVGYRIYRDLGDIRAISFSFQRKGIFMEHGVGKSRPKGSTKAKRASKPWLNPVIDEAYKEFQSEVVDKYEDAIVKEIRTELPDEILFIVNKKK
jgi:hypothetical protein